MSTYLVTGVAGFIGSKVAEMLLAEGHTVVGVDNLNDYYDVRLKDYRLSRLLGAKGEELSTCILKLGTDSRISIYAAKNQGAGDKGAVPLPLTASRFSFYQLDIENLPALDSLFSAHRFDAVFNLAARAGVRASMENPGIYRTTNVIGEVNILQCQAKYGVRKHILASSSSVYAGCPMPFTEDAKLGNMQSPYAETKYHAEMEAYGYHRLHGLDVTVLRYFTVFGPAGRPDMAPFRFIKWIDEGRPITLYGDGSQARDFTYVEDIARGTILAGQLSGGFLLSDAGFEGSNSSQQPTTKYQQLRRQTAPGYEVINLGGGNNPLSMIAMISIIEAALGKKAMINAQPASAADMAATWADISKAGRLLRWKPDTSPSDGFQNSVQWYIENRDLVRAINV